MAAAPYDLLQFSGDAGLSFRSNMAMGGARGIYSGCCGLRKREVDRFIYFSNDTRLTVCCGSVILVACHLTNLSRTKEQNVYEADVSAENSPARARAWIPPAHGNEEWAQGFEGAPCKRAAPAGSGRGTREEDQLERPLRCSGNCGCVGLRISDACAKQASRILIA